MEELARTVTTLFLRKASPTRRELEEIGAQYSLLYGLPNLTNENKEVLDQIFSTIDDACRAQDGDNACSKKTGQLMDQVHDILDTRAESAGHFCNFPEQFLDNASMTLHEIKAELQGHYCDSEVEAALQNWISIQVVEKIGPKYVLNIRD